MDSQELSNFLERVRKGRKITQEDFVDGICSLRQYQRYRNGDSEIPYERLDKFAVKLGIPYKKLLNLFEDAKNKQSRLISEFYNAVATKQHELKNNLKKQITDDILIDNENRKYYKHALIYDEFNSNLITRQDMINKNLFLINYPEILKQQYFTDIEILILSSLVKFVELPKREALLNRLSELFDDDSMIMTDGASSSERINSVILMILSEAHGISGDYESVVRFCKKGIENGLHRKQYYLFEYFYYFKALAHFRLEEYREYEDALFRCYNVLHMEGIQEKIDHFTYLIEKDFKINYHMFIMKYLKKEIM